jgi:hypothetical protein
MTRREEMDIETKEIVNQLKSRLEQFEDKDESYQEGVVRGMFFSITAMQHGIQYADKKVSLRKRDKVSIERSKPVATPPDCGCERC